MISSESSNKKNANTYEDFEHIQKRIGEILNFLKINDDRTGKITKEIKTNELNISRIDLLLKRAVILVEQVKDIGIKIQITTTLTCIKQNIKKLMHSLMKQIG